MLGTRSGDKTSPQIPMSLARRLAMDERLRKELEVNPVAVLAEHDISIDPGTLPSEIKLPTLQASGNFPNDPPPIPPVVFRGYFS